MYEMPSVAMTGLSEVASPLRPMTMSRPAASAGAAAPRPQTSVMTSSSRIMWITVDSPW